MKTEHIIASDAPRKWSAPHLQKLDIGQTRSGESTADEDLLPLTNPPS